MKSGLYEGQVLHHRLAPKINKFIYNVCYFFFDLDRTEQLITYPPFLSFESKNYLASKEIKEHLNQKFGPAAVSSVNEIYLLAQLTYFGYCYNPVSFYYCYDKNNSLKYIVSLITNTPWGEKHVNCFDYTKTDGEFKFEKDFHVSPFMPMDIDYSWRFNSPEDYVRINMNNRLFNEEKSFFYAQLHLKKAELNRKNVILSLLKFPLLSFKTLAGIYWQAVKLYLKKVPFYTHPKKSEGP